MHLYVRSLSWLRVVWLIFSSLLMLLGTQGAVAESPAPKRTEFSCQNVSEIPCSECEALVALYHSTDGDNWADNTNWLQTNRPSDWFGVNVESGHVHELYLSWNELSGEIPPELGSLTNLEELYLACNALSGQIPPELGSPTNLQVLDLYANQLSGEIPPELGSLTNLQVLYLSWNELSGQIPPELGSPTDLGALYLSCNALSGEIPPELGSLTNLEELYLSRNTLSGEIPPELGSLTNLRWLDLGYNMLCSTDPIVIAFLNGKDRDWAETQTVPPSDLVVVGATETSIELSWTLISYTSDGGYYEVGYASTPGGPYTAHGHTGDKTASGYTADGIPPDSTYYFVVRTYTPAHGYQRNELWSTHTEEISGTTSLATFTPTATSTATPTATRTSTPTPSRTPRPTQSATSIPTATPVTICSCSGPESLIYRIDPEEFHGYATDSASGSPLIHVPSPPAPTGWNQPGFVPEQLWQPANTVWWEDWAHPQWGPLIPAANIIGLRDDPGRPLGVPGITQLIRHAFILTPPGPDMRITKADLDLWSDNKTAWWWQGVLIADDREAHVGQVALYPAYTSPEGGRYLLAVQNSNDFFDRAGNPQGTAFRLCVTWAYHPEPRHGLQLPLILIERQ